MTPEKLKEHAAILSPATNIRHHLFIMQMIEHGNRRKAYQQAYPGSSAKTADMGAWRLMQNSEISLSIIRGVAERRSVRMLDLHSKMAMLEEKRKILADILRGEITTEIETDDGKGGKKTITIRADVKDRIRAIQIDNEMEDEYWEMIQLLEDHRKEQAKDAKEYIARTGLATGNETGNS